MILRRQLSFRIPCDSWLQGIKFTCRIALRATLRYAAGLHAEVLCSCLLMLLPPCLRTLASRSPSHARGQNHKSPSGYIWNFSRGRAKRQPPTGVHGREKIMGKPFSAILWISSRPNLSDCAASVGACLSLQPHTPDFSIGLAFLLKGSKNQNRAHANIKIWGKGFRTHLQA